MQQCEMCDVTTTLNICAQDRTGWVSYKHAHHTTTNATTRRNVTVLFIKPASTNHLASSDVWVWKTWLRGRENAQ